ncbi:MAG: cytochrome c oxidase assembly protein [Herpetosiphon sp.]
MWLMLSPATIVAHAFGPHTGSWWTLNPGITVGLLLLTALYFYAVGPLRRRLQLSQDVPTHHVVAFLLAMITLGLSLQGPLHELSDYYSFAMRMVQHLIITLLMPPLLLLGLPPWLVDAFLRWRPAYYLLRFVTRPFIAFTLFNVLFALWHVPGAYQMALGRPAIHSLEHILFMAAAIITWWPVFSPSRLLPRLSDPLQILYLLAQSLVPTILGAFLTFADFQLYAYYTSAPRVIGLSAPDDQQVAGLLMWLGGASVILSILTARWFHWMNEDADDALTTSHA